MSSRTSFHPLTVTEVRRETADALSIRFAVPPELADLFAFQPGQYLTLRAVIDGEDVRRTYSICAAPSDDELRVAVKALPGGRFSTHVAERLRVGDTLDALVPAGHFTWDFGRVTGGHYAAFAAGSGITPVLSLIRTALATDPQARVSLFYGNRDAGGILFLEQLAALKDSHLDRFTVHHFLTAEEDEFELLNGRLDRGKCDEILSTLIDPTAVTAFFLCGPDGMMAAAEAALLARGVDTGRILLERFAAAGAPPTAETVARSAAAAGRRIGVVLEGHRVTVPFDAAAGNILDSVRAAGLPAPYACKGGVCATCRARLRTGQVDMRVNYGLSDAEVADGYVLTCQAVPETDDVLVDYDA
ncbi:ring-1,2-phenylacetyl-CoA epoxidase subunit PaaE [Sphingomonas jejuensis]|uniref:Ring-1,2-phenylacetyl-CoA epoxidase subunit PaaE n=1 Tax=Sphingomonas jejuensis TaxID=904715 RepID=A0ABX0XNS4_9SPHN|nr:2Fe-2S iron-sulfur cluster-binding protein [Sphingomonas jejuensis]NJC34434.1 ring-1,2-phenylacetyl-CoA epoxidase subunit PaaE [Sphingomonas jejuensis]